MCLVFQEMNLIHASYLISVVSLHILFGVKINGGGIRCLFYLYNFLFYLVLLIL